MDMRIAQMKIYSKRNVEFKRNVLEQGVELL